MYDWFESCTSSQTYPGKSSLTQREAACEDIVDDDDDDGDDNHDDDKDEGQIYSEMKLSLIRFCSMSKLFDWLNHCFYFGFISFNLLGNYTKES